MRSTNAPPAGWVWRLAALGWNFSYLPLTILSQIWLASVWSQKFICLFWDRISPYSYPGCPGTPGTHSVDQNGFNTQRPACLCLWSTPRLASDLRGYAGQHCYYLDRRNVYRFQLENLISLSLSLCYGMLFSRRGMDVYLLEYLAVVIASMNLVEDWVHWFPSWKRKSWQSPVSPWQHVMIRDSWRGENPLHWFGWL